MRVQGRKSLYSVLTMKIGDWSGMAFFFIFSTSTVLILISEMVAMGLSRKEAVRFFALFFQIRRAFYFIGRIIGQSPSMKELRRSLWNNIFTHDIWLYDQYLWNRMEDFSTMLLGATGTGKGLAASAIGRAGFIPFNEKKGCFAESFTRVFISINLSQYPEQLVESELFGHKKGAFTGAIEGHDGIFSLCSPSGAIFLDEIGEVTIPVQIKLLQVLQDRIFSPVGSHSKDHFYGRVIAATNRSIEALRKEKVFRDDFYYRLCSDIITLPPLSQRIHENPVELDDLLAHTVKRIIGTPSPELVLQTLKILRQQIPSDYPWPGNVRELEQCVRRILLKQEYEGDRTLLNKIEPDTFNEILVHGDFTAQQLVSRYCKVLHKSLGTYEAVARRTELDRRTVKKYVNS
jgi:transcriptional regulator with PAS, ATPase and Fis domain